MDSGLEWHRLFFACALLLALFCYPVIVIWADERKKRRRDPVDPPD
ncbi:hypothetical protein M6D93_02045 [Jatrophihabitans telluris]|uniref:Uncharacterized protein n=1 Tax=Jatrophihabitans telluris TaxID=2038343 RepID=A0ABY4R182_9ACTN|nr:hypothetical protein [Jatrophihabitans telluris]UQX88794.1 hypothetical protein M6D93_02045 [Jatrophihabitans telluris]